MTNKQLLGRASRELGAFNYELNHNENRATGRTFRMLIQAVLACSSSKERKTIYVIGANGNHCRNMFNQTLNILDSVGGLDISGGEILMPNGSRILFATKCWLDRRVNSMRVRIAAGDVFEDHYSLESRYE